MIFSFRLHQNSWQNKNRQTIRVGGLPLLRRRLLFGDLSRRASAGTLAPAQGTVALHCSVARLISESFLMSVNNGLRHAGLQPELCSYHDLANLLAAWPFANLPPRIRVNFLKVSPAGEGCGIADCAIVRQWADRKFILRICDDILSRSRATCAAIDSRRRLPFQSPAQIPNPPTQTHRRRAILLFRQ